MKNLSLVLEGIQLHIQHPIRTMLGIQASFWTAKRTFLSATTVLLEDDNKMIGSEHDKSHRQLKMIGQTPGNTQSKSRSIQT
jgi:hypothetical protein